MFIAAHWKKLVALVVALIVASGALCYFVPVFKINNVEVNGSVHAAPSDVEATSGIVRGANILRLKESDVAANVAALPWVGKVSVHRSFPTTVTINIDERQAVLYAKRNDGEHLIDAGGKPFVIDVPPPGVVEISGTREDNTRLYATAISIVQSLDPDTRGALERIDAKSEYEFTLFLAGGKEVYWGSAEQAHDKALATRAVMKREGARWNVSSPGLITLRP
ncbi:cell division protein FtsQ/DivIB [Corynebacterium epidermidicanis]|uniref:POTRA domain, FtsQ-type/Cell division protein FtsQ n=1 Tax=Corynebacterium epidermidicanis TaxID=1050174 RepID=A0A0G3GQV6_9CORY|nr:FtsQ-type POTRA domain-containing protein [Corynebacterium epidermidicanis]AKK03519.1 POTRA domain, FtsQ-type/Cell division protein FtsQ [Corynebacterium epidermidicanis]